MFLFERDPLKTYENEINFKICSIGPEARVRLAQSLEWWTCGQSLEWWTCAQATWDQSSSAEYFFS